MLGYFFANGKSSQDFGVYITDADAYGIAEKDVETISINGKNGDLIRYNNRYKNKSFRYPSVILSDFDVNFSALLNYLSEQSDYMRIEDSFHPNIYVLARYVGETNPIRVTTEGMQGTFELTFERKPQKFLKEGEKVIEITGSSTIYNFYQTVAKPLIRAYGTGSFTINGVTITINSANGYTDIDCDLQEAYKDTLATNCNGNITLVNNKFPTLVSGENSVSISNITRLEITPRWWIL